MNEVYGEYRKTEDIDFNKLPDRFVLKATHGWSMNIICKDKSKLDIRKSIKTLDKWLKMNHYYRGREWAYKHIQPRIICEKYLENEQFQELLDYKFYCYSGEPFVVFVCAGRFSKQGVSYKGYDMDWNPTDICKGKPCCTNDFLKPDNFNEMIEIVKILSKGFPFVRIDLYSVENEIIFGEYTFYPDSGFIPFTPEKYNLAFGELFDLTKVESSFIYNTN